MARGKLAFKDNFMCVKVTFKYIFDIVIVLSFFSTLKEIFKKCELPCIPNSLTVPTYSVQQPQVLEICSLLPLCDRSSCNTWFIFLNTNKYYKFGNIQVTVYKLYLYLKVFERVQEVYNTKITTRAACLFFRCL